MGSPERTRSSKRDTEENLDLKSPKDDEVYEGDDKRKHRSSKSRKSNNHLEESKKRSVGSGDDYDEYESRRESRLKQMKKKQEESALEKLSNWYQDGEGGDNRHDGGDNKSRRKSSSRKHDERSNDADIEKAVDERESRSDRRENSRERNHNSRRRLDESVSLTRKTEESEETEARSGRSNDHDNKQEKTRERSVSAKTEQIDIIKTRSLDPNSEKEEGKSKTPEENPTLSENNADEDTNNSNTWVREKDRRSEKDHYRNNRDNRDYQGRPGGRDRLDYTNRPGGSRKEIGNRTEAVKTSSNYGISSENYDVIEIQTKPFDHARDDSAKSSQNDDDHAKDKIKFIDEKGRGGQKGNLPNRSGGSQNSPLIPQGYRGNRGGGGQNGKLPMPMMGSPFGPLGMLPAVPMSPVPGPPMSPAVFIPPFSPPVWPGLSPVPTGPRFPIGTPPNPAMYLRGPPNPNFNPIVPTVRMQPQDNMNNNNNKPSGGWVPPPRNISGPAGKAPSRGEQNDYSQNFVDTGMRPQNFIRELELTSVVEDYPKLRELIQKKDEIVAKSASTPMYYKCDLREQVLTPELFGTKFDVILVDPPWEEYVHRAPGVTDHMDYWTLEEIMNLKIEAIADTPSFIFLWVGDGVGLEQGRQCLKKWGFRRCEDICWVKTNKTNATPGLRHDSHTLFQRSKEHCLMGIKGTVRRSTDGHIIHANIDTDVIIAEEPPYGSTAKPEDMYRIVEHFSLGRRRLELFGEDHNIRSGWLTVGKDLSSSNFNAEGYLQNFADNDGKVWQGGGGRNPPPEAGHLVVTTPDIEALRPKSPMKNQQQQAQAITSTSTNAANNSNNRRSTTTLTVTANSPHHHQDPAATPSNNPPPWAPPIDAFKPGIMGPASDFDSYVAFNPNFPQGNPAPDFDSHRAGM